MKPVSFRAVTGALSLLAALIVGVGCSSGGIKKTTIHGTVSYKGQPLHSGMLRFVGTNGEFSMATIQQDGTYIMSDVIPGEVKVGLTDEPQSVGDSSGKTTGKPQPKQVVLPSKYYDPEKSGVKYTINPDTTELNIEFP